MVTITQEITALQAEFEQILEAWNGLSSKDRRQEWNKYLDAIDQGDAGWTRFDLVLDSPYQQGFDPIGGLTMGEFGVAPARAEAPA